VNKQMVILNYSTVYFCIDSPICSTCTFFVFHIISIITNQKGGQCEYCIKRCG